MENGVYIYYLIQFRTIFSSRKTAVSKSDLKRRISESKRGEWIDCSDDFWGRSMNPNVGKEWRPRYPAADKQWFDCFNKTGWYGWFNVRYALAALKRVRCDDAAGMYDVTDNYGKKSGTTRHEFRIVKLVQTYQRDESELTIDDLVE